MIGPQDLVFPPISDPEDQGTGLFPVDFLVEDVLTLGLKWFRTAPDAPAKVFSHLRNKFLSEKYGDKKIREIVDYMNKYELRIVQHFSMIPEQLPCISIQLLDGGEMTERAGLGDHESMIDSVNANDEVLGRTEMKYAAISDSVHIGIHAADTPDLCKYLYYLVSYILILYKQELETRGLHLSTFRATDLSRLNEYLPANVYSRFINFSAFSVARVDAGDRPMVKKFDLKGLAADNGGITLEDEG